MGLVAPQHVGSSQTRDRAHVSCIDRQILYHCTPVFLPGKSHRQRRLAGYGPRGCKESDLTERPTHTHTHTHTHTCSQEKPCVPCGSLLTLQPSAPGLMAHTHPPSANDCSLCTLRRRHGLTRIVGIFALKIVSESSVQRRQLLFETELISHGFQFLQMLDILSFR